MKRIIAGLSLFFLLLISGLSETAPGPRTYVSVYGSWPLCAYNVVPQEYCDWYVPGTETYMLLIYGGDAPISVTNYSYIITATMGDGTERVIHGTVERDPNESKYGGYTTVCPLSFGGIISSYRVVISDLYSVQREPGSVSIPALGGRRGGIKR